MREKNNIVSCSNILNYLFRNHPCRIFFHWQFPEIFRPTQQLFPHVIVAKQKRRRKTQIERLGNMTAHKSLRTLQAIPASLISFFPPRTVKKIRARLRSSGTSTREILTPRSRGSFTLLIKRDRQFISDSFSHPGGTFLLIFSTNTDGVKSLFWIPD